MCPINIQSEFYQCRFSSSLAVFNEGRAGEPESIFMHHFTQTVLLTSFMEDGKEGIVIKRKKNSGIVDTVLLLAGSSDAQHHSRRSRSFKAGKMHFTLFYAT